MFNNVSKTFTIFNGSKSYYDDPEQAFRDISEGNLSKLKKFDGDYNLLYDYNNNNLLHSAVLTEQISIIDFLIRMNVNKNHFNKFKITPFDYALRTQKKEIIKLFIDDSYQKINSLVDENIMLKTKNKSLIEENDNQKKEITILNTHNKRLRNEITALENDNEILTQQNKRLKKSVDNLTQHFKK
jgi:hypothetical protein